LVVRGNYLVKRLLATAITLTLYGCASVRDATAGTSRFLISYFYGEDAGALLALSNDGIHWKPINGGEPVIRPRAGDIIRDPSIIRRKDGSLSHGLDDRVDWPRHWVRIVEGPDPLG
jgi:hypothetical protein